MRPCAREGAHPIFFPDDKGETRSRALGCVWASGQDVSGTVGDGPFGRWSRGGPLLQRLFVDWFGWSLRTFQLSGRQGTNVSGSPRYNCSTTRGAHGPFKPLLFIGLEGPSQLGQWASVPSVHVWNSGSTLYGIFPVYRSSHVRGAAHGFRSVQVAIHASRGVRLARHTCMRRTYLSLPSTRRLSRLCALNRHSSTLVFAVQCNLCKRIRY